jgi:CheY-like chemotaxis protein
MAKILLIDDEADVAVANRAELEAQGHHVQVAGSSAEGLEAVDKGHPDAVVLETMVRGPVEGFDFADTLAQRLGRVPLIVLTRADDVLDLATRRRQDRDGWVRAARFFEKPVPPALLAEEVEHVLHEASASAPAPTSAAAQPGAHP